VKINLHHHLLHNRRNAVRVYPAPLDNLLQTTFVFVMCRPGLYQLAARLGRLAQPLQRLIRGTVLDPLRAWTKTRSFPALAEKSFRDRWRERKTP
jgi:L-lactate dehydrogenase complex protein LldF